jgi:hypothetical protein
MAPARTKECFSDKVNHPENGGLSNRCNRAALPTRRADRAPHLTSSRTMAKAMVVAPSALLARGGPGHGNGDGQGNHGHKPPLTPGS